MMTDTNEYFDTSGMTKTAPAPLLDGKKVYEFWFYESARHCSVLAPTLEAAQAAAAKWQPGEHYEFVSYRSATQRDLQPGFVSAIAPDRDD